MTEAPAAAEAGRPRAGLRMPSRTTLLLGAWGLIVAIALVAVLARGGTSHVQLMQTRVDEMGRAIAVLQRGGPLLLECKQPYGAPGTRLATDCYAAGVSDDQGSYVYVPLLAQAIGTSDPRLALKWLFILLMVPIAALYPLLFRRLTGSVLAGLVAPVVFVSSLGASHFLDIYWIAAWSFYLGFPLLFLVLRRAAFDRRSVAVLLALCVAAGFATSIRNHMGLPIAIGAIAIALLRQPGRLRKLALVLALAVVNFLPSTGMLTLARHLRDSETGIAYSKGRPTTHPFWHSAYIGLGYLPNRYAITYKDESGIAEAARRDPQAVYLSKPYEAALRTAWFDVLQADPWLVVRNVVLKAWETVAAGWHSLTGLVLLLAGGLAFSRRLRRESLLVVPALGIGLVSTMLTVPIREYELTWISAVGVLALMATAWAAAGVGRGLTEAFATTPPRRPVAWLAEVANGVRAVGPGRARRCALALVCTGVAVTALVLAASRFPGGEPAALAASASSPLRLPSPTPALSAFSFAGSPAGWKVESGTTATPAGDGLVLHADRGGSSYLLTSPQLTLPAGRYRLEIDAELFNGGYQIDIANDTIGHVGTGRYSATIQDASRRQVADFTLASEATFGVQLLRWTPDGPWSPTLARTDLLLRSIRIVPR